MGSDIEIVGDENGLAVIGDAAAVDRFFLSAGIDPGTSRELDLHRLRSVAGTAGTAALVGVGIAENSGRWVKLTAESAAAVREFGLMPSKIPGVSHAMIGNPGDIKQWLQIANAPGALLGGPFALTALATMMQQQAMQQQMDEIVEYLKEIDEKVDDILRAQKDAVLSDMIGVDLVIEEAMAVRQEVGRVSEVTWSKVQATGMALARTQAYAIRQLDAIAAKLEEHADLGEIAKATKEAEPQVREWLAVLALTFQLQEGAAVLELDRVLDAAPEDLENHRRGLATARNTRLNVIGSSTARLLTQMDKTIERANSKVLFNPFDAPAAVKSSDLVASGVLDFRGRLGLESSRGAREARRWRQAVLEAGDKVGRAGARTYDRATEPFRAVDIDGDGVPDRSPAALAAEEAGAALKEATTGVAGAFETLFGRRKPNPAASQTRSDESQ